LFDQVSNFARQHAERTALITGSRRISYGELDDRAKRVGNGLHALQLERQSRIATLCRTGYVFGDEQIRQAGQKGVATWF